MRYTPISELYRQVRERKLTPQEIEDREKIAKKLPMDDFKKRYGKDAMAVKMATATNIVKKKSAKSEVKEDGHTDVASAIRQCKTVTEDAMQILQKLKSMSPEDSLPSWWTNKLAVASNSMNKLRDYFLVPSVSEEVELDEKAGDIPDLQKLIGELQNASKMHLAQSKRVQAHVDMMTRANAKGPEGAGGLQDLKKIVGELEKASQAHLRQSKSIDAHVGFMNKMEQDDPVKSAQDKADKLLKIAKVKQDAKDDIERIKATEEVKLDEQFDFVLLDKDNKIVARASGKNAKKEMESSKRSAHLPPMRIPKNEVGKMKIVPISPKDKKDIGDMVLAIGEEVELDENFSPRMIVKLKKIYEPLKGKKVNPTPLLKIFDKIDSNKDALIQLYKADIPFVSTMAMSRLIKKHDMKGDQVKKLREENDRIKELIQSGKFTRPEIKKMIERNILEQSSDFFKKARMKAGLPPTPTARSAAGYELFHKTFSGAMQHAYAMAKKNMGMTVDKKEIDDKVATGPKKPGVGKTNRYSLKTNKGMLQIQVYNRGGSKPFELNMYSS